MKYFIFLSLVAVSIFAETTPIVLKQIVLANDTEIDLTTISSESIQIDPDLSILEIGTDLKRALLNQYIGKTIDMDLIHEIEKTVVQFYRDGYKPFLAVNVSEQDISQGVLVLKILEGRVEKVTVMGNSYFKASRFKDWSSIKTGETLKQNAVYDDLSWFNRNPYRIVDAVFSPGRARGTTDIDYVVRDRFPLRVYVGIDNTGNDFTGNDRLFAGINWGDFFGTDQVFSYQYTTDNEFKRLQAHTGYYQIPLPWKNMLTFYGGYSYIDTKFDVPNFSAESPRFRNNGYSGQLSMRYDIPLPSFRGFVHEVSWGTDWKTMNNAILYNEVSLNPHKVNLFQLMVRYNLGYDIDHFKLTFEVEAFANPGKWLPDQSNEDYSSIRLFAKNAYFYTRGLLKMFWRFVDPLVLTAKVRGQGATANLLPSEEVGVGGYASVRGYKERQFNADNSLLINTEIQTFPVSILKHLMRRFQGDDQFQVLAFFDYGLANVHKLAPGEIQNANIYSIGAGGRYFVNPYVSAQIDWGYQLHHYSGTGPHSRLHFYTSIAY